MVYVCKTKEDYTLIVSATNWVGVPTCFEGLKEDCLNVYTPCVTTKGVMYTIRKKQLSVFFVPPIAGSYQSTTNAQDHSKLIQPSSTEDMVVSENCGMLISWEDVLHLYANSQ